MSVANPTTSSQPEESQNPGSRPISRLEIGLIVGTIVLFVALISFIFIIRILDQRHRKKHRMRMAEEARNRTPEEETLRRWLAWMTVERIKRSLQFVWVDKDNNPTDPPPDQLCFEIVVERLSKNINEQHLYEIFGQFGRIKDLDLPINRTFGTNRGTAYILYHHEDDAEAAIAHMHEAQMDGSAINVSIVLPRRKLSPAPPTARRGANIDPRVPFAGARGGPPGVGMGGNSSMGGGGRRRASPGSRYGPRSDVYRPGSRSPSRSSAGPPPSRGGGGSRYRSRSNNSYSSRSRSRSPSPRRKGASRNDDHETRRRGSIDSYGDRSRSRSRGRGSK
ncbi:hypothetical protein IL306_005740 [Fusarium sp. DS 682]|nr:hypothetical protein IL306_005740 [Fusarium sp. DS 682]